MDRRRARRWIGAAVAALGLAAAPGGTWAFHGVAVGDPLPAFTLTAAGGGAVTVSGGGQATVVAFVRQGQDKSAEALAVLRDLAGAYGDRLGVVAVVVNPDEGDAAAWAAAGDAGFPVLLDEAGEVYGRYGVRVMPATGVAALDGTLAGSVDGFTRRYRDEVEHLVRAALGEEPADQPAAAPAPAKSAERKAAERALEKARLLRKRKMQSKALAGARAAVEADGEYLEARLFLGELLLDAGDERAAEAQPQFQKALELDPHSLDAKVGLARVKAAQGDTAEAVAVLEKAAAVTPRSEKLYYELGRIHERQGEHQAAARAYRKALEKLLK